MINVKKLLKKGKKLKDISTNIHQLKILLNSKLLEQKQEELSMKLRRKAGEILLPVYHLILHQPKSGT